MSKLVDRTGQRYGRLVVLERAPDQIFSSGRKVVCWKCQCDCGNIVTVATTSLQSGATKSCGCWNKEQIHKSETKYSVHGDHSKESPYHSLYNRWLSMNKRCYLESKDGYENYGGRGITVCDEWRNNYLAFKEWALQHGYEESLTLDRIDVNGNYCPENCRWVSIKIQQNNKRNNYYITYNNITHTLAEWAELTGLNRSTLSDRLERGWSIERALTTPPLK